MRRRLKEVKSSALSLIFDHTDLWIRDVGETLSSFGHSLLQDAKDMGGVAEGGEHHDGGQERGEEVNHRHNVHVHPGVKLVVAAEHDVVAEV